ncbi:transporter substrate-binding domain-containing protein [Marinobacteraceae bacterium S3BR75-40.1]
MQYIIGLVRPFGLGVMGVALLLAITPVSAEEEARPLFVYCYSDSDLFPFHLNSEDRPAGERSGIDIDLMRELQARLPLRIEFRTRPWKRCLHGLRTGEVSGVIATHQKAREKLGVYPRDADGNVDPEGHVYIINYALYARSGTDVRYDPGSGRIQNSTGLPVIGRLGFSVIRDLRRAGNDVETVADSQLKNFLRLAKGRAGGVVALQNHGDYLLEKYPATFSSVVRTRPAISQKSGYLLISHRFHEQYPQLVERIWGMLRILRDQKLKQLYDKYYASQTP